MRGGGGVTEGKLQKLVYCTRTVPEMEKVQGGGVTEGKLQKLVYCTRTVPEMEKVRGGGYRGQTAEAGLLH